MSLATVQAHLAQYHLADRITSHAQPTATVKEAAQVHGVKPGQIAKTLSFKVNNLPILILAAGDTKIDNKKFKDHFSTKAKMLSAEEAIQLTNHPIGGICPFGLPQPIDTYLDISLKPYAEVIVSAGAKNATIKLTIQELEKYSNSQSWIDVCKMS